MGTFRVRPMYRGDRRLQRTGLLSLQTICSPSTVARVSMAFLIGVDEAGYGPNLGPLVVAATVWQVPDLTVANLYLRLADCVCDDPSKVNQRRVAIADSKRLFKSRGSLAQLERAIYSGLGCLGHSVETWQKVWSTLAPDSLEQRSELPWYTTYDEPVPVDFGAENKFGRSGLTISKICKFVFCFD